MGLRVSDLVVSDLGFDLEGLEFRAMGFLFRVSVFSNHSSDLVLGVGV